jgi:hypothetical protein
MCEVPANASAFRMSFRGSAVGARVMVTKLDATVSVVEDSLRPLPPALNAAKERPG